AGADATPLVRFEEHFGGETVHLVRNYRSSPAVVAMAETALGDAAQRRVPPEAVRKLFSKAKLLFLCSK
ncbi:MAG: hypothetical protein ACKOA8_09470, partial [Deltaproteobacteria bacterium]